jgi:NAD+--dinitrogen-reductase ADP-D-ribosyltransferase
MCVVFGFESEKGLRNDSSVRRQYRKSYLRLIQDWRPDSSNAQGAVFKGWVESRFGLLPTYHKRPIASFICKDWIMYIEEKKESRYRKNCIYLQLDLLYKSYIQFDQAITEAFFLM